MIEPRRLAARAAATRLAQSLDEPVGERIGFAVRGERRSSARTRVEVITDGLFLRRLQTDPSLDGVSCVLFDEFHERRRDTDLAIALLREAAPLLRPDLAIALMSATLDISDLLERLPHATVITSDGRAYPVATIHQPPRPDERLPQQVLRALETHALPLPRGSGVLVFLPGVADIERCRERLDNAPSLRHWQVSPLHGQLPLEQQSAASRRCPQSCDGVVVLATSIAESSVTIDGVRLVIDSGLSRQLRFDPNTGWKASKPFPPARPVPISAGGGLADKAQGSVYGCGHRQNSNDDPPSAHRNCSWRIHNRCCSNWPSGVQAWGRTCPGSIHLLRPCCRKGPKASRNSEFSRTQVGSVRWDGW